MKKSAIFFLLSFSFSTLAADSCKVAINTDDLGLSVVEKAKIELQLQKKDYELAYKMKAGFTLFAGAGFGMGAEDHKMLMMDKIKLENTLNDKGEPLFKILRHNVSSMPALDGSYSVQIEETVKPASEVEIVLRSMSGDVEKVLRPKKKLFGLMGDKGSAGYKLLAGLVRDLPSCEKQEAINNTARSSGKDTPSINFGGGYNAGTTVIGF